ncbi:lsu ribosomal protein l25p [hydrocarbon metagenome]|uniref:Lsu ribosomal protein l25p n=1 Tax=hydrocarbon metagenome TaxID=938273 RepID=A0A0W8E9B5_9ZZZZ
MTAAIALTCKIREKKTKGYLNEMLKQEWIPGIVYGQEQTPLPVFLNRRDLYKKMSSYGSRGIFTLDIEGDNKPVMALVREVQKQALSGHIIHIDFLTINMSEKISSKVGIHIEGEEELIKKGSILQVGTKEVEVSCLPKDLPEVFTVDVSGLDSGDRIMVGDLTLPVGVELNETEDTIICAVLSPSKGTAQDLGEEEAGEDQE